MKPIWRRFSVRFCRIAGYAAVLPLGIMSMSSSWADTCTGYDVIINQSAETTDLGQGLKQTSFKGQSVLLSTDSVYNLMAGECAGTSLQTPDGKTQSMGYCARRDKDGNAASISWRQASGADKGEWKITGGTGKFAGKQDAGWFQNVLADGKASVVKWGGDCH